MDTDSDLTLTCQQCGRTFTFTQAEQEFYQQKGFTQPHRCKQCRTARNSSRSPMLCATCGSKLEDGAPAYCAACLENVQLEFEMKARGLKEEIDLAHADLGALESEKLQLAREMEEKVGAAENEKAQSTGEIGARLSTVESEKTRLEGLLAEKERAVTELQDQLNKVSLELEKARKYRAALEWLGPTLKNMREQLQVLERNQETLSQALLRLVQKIDQSRTSGNMMDAIRRFFHPNQHFPAPSQ